MTSPAARKGNKYERELAAYFNAQGVDADRLRMGGTVDKGDFQLRAGALKVTVEAKNQKTMTLSKWLAEAQQESVNADSDLGVVAVRKRGTTDAGQSYVVLTLEDFLKLLDI